MGNTSHPAMRIAQPCSYDYFLPFHTVAQPLTNTSLLPRFHSSIMMSKPVKKIFFYFMSGFLCIFAN